MNAEPEDPVSTEITEEFRAALGRDLVEAAYLTGDFVLSSGQRSSYYLDKYLFETQPSILRRLARLMGAHVPQGTDRLAGPELGAVALAAVASMETDLPFVIVRKEPKGYGTAKHLEGTLSPGERVLVVEDVITSGGEAIRAAQRLTEVGAHVIGILGVVDREQGGPERIAEAGFVFTALYTRTQLGV